MGTGLASNGAAIEQSELTLKSAVGQQCSDTYAFRLSDIQKPDVVPEAFVSNNIARNQWLAFAATGTDTIRPALRSRVSLRSGTWHFKQWLLRVMGAARR